MPASHHSLSRSQPFTPSATKAHSLFAYFDTNVFGHLFKKTYGITDQHERILRATIRSGELCVFVGVHAIDETAANPGDPVPELRLIWELCDWERIIKPADVLLEDDVRHFAYNGEAGHPFLDAGVRDDLRRGMRELLKDPSKLAELRNLVASALPQRKQFRQNIQQLKSETQAQFLAATERERVGSFNEYFEKEVGLAAGWLTEHLGLKEQCQARAVDDFLKIRSIRMAVGTTLSYIWGVNVEKSDIKPSDGRDFQHAISAAGSGADFFVTHDEGLAKLVERVPFKGLAVTTLSQLADKFGSRGQP
jgi:hypothetical protein